MSAIHTLLRDAIDYAGLFPPAALSMSEAVYHYANYCFSLEAWAMSRFICPFSRLAEFESSVKSLPPDLRNQTWRLAALIGNDWQADLDAVAAFNSTFSRAPRSLFIDAVEGKLAAVSEIQSLNVPPNLVAYLEIPISENPEPLIEAIAQRGFRAKARTGGVTAAAFPTAEHLARFLASCAKYRVPFKATAGLHHPIRGEYRLTYEPDSPTGAMFGFLNLFLAAAFARQGMSEPDLVALLNETEIQTFAFEEEWARWRAHHLSLAELAAARRQFAVSFGSCSFEEPISDLKHLNLLSL